MRVSWLDVVTAIATVGLVFGLTLILRKTMLGIHLRASTEDFRMAGLVGVRANVVISAAFALTGVLAGVDRVPVRRELRLGVLRHGRQPGADRVRRRRRWAASARSTARPSAASCSARR